MTAPKPHTDPRGQSQNTVTGPVVGALAMRDTAALDPKDEGC